MQYGKNDYGKGERPAQLTLRGVVIGILGAVIITASSMYVALRMGALPWPTIFVAIMSMAVLKILGHTNLNEINVTHTIMSAGSMVAGGLAFTLPGIWILNFEEAVDPVALIAVSRSGTVLGVIFTALVRKYFIEIEALPFPMGIAAAETLTVGDEGGGKSKALFSTMAGMALFTAIRDWFGKIPAVCTFDGLWAKNIFFGFWVSPMAAAIGYIIGPLFTGVWFVGAVLGYLFIIPVGVAQGWFADVAAATAFKDSLGIGLMVGTGLGVLIKGILPKAKEIYGPLVKNFSKKEEGSKWRWMPVGFAAVALLLTGLTDLSLVASMMTIAGVWLTTAMAAQITGQTGINPMEVFGIIVLLSLKAFLQIGQVEAFLLSGVVAVACGLTGDVLNDFKSGYLLGTNPRAQLVGEAIGGVVGSLVAVVVLIFMMKAFGGVGPGTGLPAPQAYAVSTMVGGLPDLSAFFIGLALGVLLYVLNVPSMTLGIGIYLPMFISATVFLGGFAKWVQMKVRPGVKADGGIVIASGMLGGEGVTGVVIAIAKVITMG